MELNVKASKDLKNPSEIGTHYRLLCMTGPNKGIVYYLIGKRVLVGRGNNTDIQILDGHTSREHAELTKVDNKYIITDLGAQNGIIVNDTHVKQQALNDGEKIVIGQSVFKYNIVEVKRDRELELAELGPDSELAQEIKKGIKGKKPLRNANETKKETEKKPNKEEGGNKSRTIIFGIVVVAVVFILVGGEDEKKVNPNQIVKKVDMDEFNESVSVKKTTVDPESQKKLDSLIHSGRREFREGNYFRAMEEFRLALLLSPNNGHASFYLSKSKQKLDEEISRNFDKGTQELDSKKYQAAIISFCGIAQLIKEYPNDERYKNALLKISSIESSLGMEKGEIKCFEEKSPNSTD